MELITGNGSEILTTVVTQVLYDVKKKRISRAPPQYARIIFAIKYFLTIHEGLLELSGYRREYKSILLYAHSASPRLNKNKRRRRT